MRCQHDRPAPRRRRACYAEVWHFVTDVSNPQRLRYARAVLDAWFNGGRHPHAFLRQSLRDRSCIPSPVHARQPRIAGAVDAPPEKAYDAENAQAARPKGKCYRGKPHRSAYCPSSGALCAGEEGLSGDRAPISYHSPFVFIKLFTLSVYPILHLRGYQEITLSAEAMRSIISS